MALWTPIWGIQPKVQPESNLNILRTLLAAQTRWLLFVQVSLWSVLSRWPLAINAASAKRYRVPK